MIKKQDHLGIGQLDLSPPKENYCAGPISDEMMEKINKMKNGGFRSRKYRKAQKTYSRFLVHDFHRKNPEWGLKEILLTIIGGYPAEMPAELYAELARHIVEVWGKIEKREAVPA